MPKTIKKTNVNAHYYRLIISGLGSFLKGEWRALWIILKIKPLHQYNSALKIIKSANYQRFSLLELLTYLEFALTAHDLKVSMNIVQELENRDLENNDKNFLISKYKKAIDLEKDLTDNYQTTFPKIYNQNKLKSDIKESYRKKAGKHPLTEIDYILSLRNKKNNHNGEIAYYLKNLNIGGSQRQIVNIIKGISKRKNSPSLHLLCDSIRDFKREPGFYLQALNTISANIKEINRIDLAPMNQIQQEIVFTLFHYQRFITNAKKIIKLYKVYQDLKPSIVHLRGGNLNINVLSAILAGVPKIIIHFGSCVNHAYKNLELRNKNLAILQKLIHYPQIKLICNSNDAALDWANALEINQGEIKILYNGISIEEFHQVPQRDFVREKLNIPKGLYVIGQVHRFDPAKDPKEFIHIASELLKRRQDLYFLMIGDGILKRDCEELVKDLNLQKYFLFTGSINNQLNEYYNVLDLYVQTSITESLPNVLLEAQAAGVPVIATDVGGTRECLLSGETGYLVKLGDRVDFVNKILEFLQPDQNLRKKMSEKSINYINNHFSLETMIKKTLEYYHDEN